MTWMMAITVAVGVAVFLLMVSFILYRWMEWVIDNTYSLPAPVAAAIATAPILISLIILLAAALRYS